MFTCKRCGYVGKKLADLKKHFHRKTLCNARDSSLSYSEMLSQIENKTYWNAETTSSDEAPITAPKRDCEKFNILKMVDLRKDIKTEIEYEEEVNRGMLLLGVSDDFFDKHPHCRVLVTPDMKMLLISSASSS